MILTNLSTTWYTELQQALLESFNLEGFELLCSKFNMRIEQLHGVTLGDKVASLIEQMEQQDRIAELLDTCQQLHTRISWADIRQMLPKSTPLVPLSERFSMQIQPNILDTEGICEVIINNEGIQRTNYTITGSDPLGALNLTNEQERQKVVSPGYSARLTLHVAPKKRPLFGLPKYLPFTIYVSTPDHYLQAATGHIIVKPLLSTWFTKFAARLTNHMPAKSG